MMAVDECVEYEPSQGELGQMLAGVGQDVLIF